jgi:glutathione synthase
MNVLFVADPLENLDASVDATVGLMYAAQDRGDVVWVTEVRDLELVDTRPRALAYPIELAPSRPAGGCRWEVAHPWFRAGAARRMWLDDADAVFLRTDPPMDETYLNATFILDLADPARTAVINDPRGLRACNEHLLPLQFVDLIPATLVTSNPATLRAFVDERCRCVAKPIDGHAGHGVLILDSSDPNLGSLSELATRQGRRAIVVQPYLPEVVGGNKRIFVLDGQPQAAVLRYPQRGDFRIGEPAESAPLTARDRHICRRLAPTLARHGLRMAGLDVIGPYLIEVNLTSPGALRKADALLGTSLCAAVVDRVLDHRQPVGRPA